MDAEKIAARMGEPEAVAAFTTNSFRYPTWGGRHPVLLFVLAPMPVALGLFAAYVYGFICVFLPNAERLPFDIIKQVWMASVCLPVLAMGWFTWRWWYSTRNWMWLVAVTANLLLFSVCFWPSAWGRDRIGERTVAYGLCRDLSSPWLWLPVLILAIAIYARHRVPAHTRVITA